MPARRPKRLALLVYLGVAAPSGFRRRDEVLSLFWPERDDQSGRTALRKSLHFLRRHPGAAALPGRGDEIGVAPNLIWTDVHAFRTAIAAGRPAEGLELYRGDLLEAFHASGSPGFGGWLDGEFRRLRRTATQASLEVAKSKLEAGDLQGASNLVQRAASLSPGVGSGGAPGGHHAS